MTAIAIGGYFGWENSTGGGLDWLRRATSYQSARCAIVAFLRVAKPKRIWVPNYICGAVNDALTAVGVSVKRYPLSSTWSVPSDLFLDAGDWLLCVDYFGICRTQTEAILERFGPERVLVDASQSLFHKPREKETAVYSPRKFVGVPDGGLLLTDLELPPPGEADEVSSLIRCKHLRSRSEGRVADGHLQFQTAEESLKNCEPMAMSKLTAALIDSVDAEGIAERRVANYGLLASQLSMYGTNVPELRSNTVPLCCPVADIEAPRKRKELAAKGIYTPSYWPDSIIPEDDTYGLRLRDATLFLPCDQRYAAPEMLQVVSSLLQIKDRP
jgi:hypothetical protein